MSWRLNKAPCFSWPGGMHVSTLFKKSHCCAVICYLGKHKGIMPINSYVIGMCIPTTLHAHRSHSAGVHIVSVWPPLFMPSLITLTLLGCAPHRRMGHSPTVMLNKRRSAIDHILEQGGGDLFQGLKKLQAVPASQLRLSEQDRVLEWPDAPKVAWAHWPKCSLWPRQHIWKLHVRNRPAPRGREGQAVAGDDRVSLKGGKLLVNLGTALVDIAKAPVGLHRLSAEEQATQANTEAL